MKIEKLCVCEICGKEYRTDKEAFACEESHKKPDIGQNKTDRRADLKKKAEEKLGELFNLYITTFHEIPEIELCDEAKKYVEDGITSALCDFISGIADML